MKKNKKEIQEELEALAPSFSKMKKEEGFQVPENYFNKLPDEILKKLDLVKEEEVVEKRTSWWTPILENLIMLMQPRIAVGLATIALLLVGIFYLKNNNADTNDLFAELTAEEAGIYLLENIDEFEDDLLFEMALSSDVENNDQEEQALDEYFDEIIDEMDDSTLEEFL